MKLSVLLALIMLMGCRTSSDSSAVKSDGDVASAGMAAWGKAEGSCGGLAGFSCDQGLTCIGAGPADRPGICKANTPTWGELNGHCGGFAGFACGPNLICKGARAGDVPGICKPKTLGIVAAADEGLSVGGHCGGIAGLACKSGLTCAGIGPGDQAGTCTATVAPAWGELNGHCGGFVGFACASGLHCVGAGPGDQTGTCLAAATGNDTAKALFSCSAGDFNSKVYVLYDKGSNYLLNYGDQGEVTDQASLPRSGAHLTKTAGGGYRFDVDTDAGAVHILVAGHASTLSVQLHQAMDASIDSLTCSKLH